MKSNAEIIVPCFCPMLELPTSPLCHAICRQLLCLPTTESDGDLQRVLRRKLWRYRGRPLRHLVFDRMNAQDPMRLVDARNHSEPVHLRLAVIYLLEAEDAL